MADHAQKNSASVVLGIDVGGSTTKIVGFRLHPDGTRTLMSPLFVRATDPITSIYGALGRYTSENGLELADIRRVMTTGVGSSPFIPWNAVRFPNFRALA